MPDNRSILAKGLDAAGFTKKQAQHYLAGGTESELPLEVQQII